MEWNSFAITLECDKKGWLTESRAYGSLMQKNKNKNKENKHTNTERDEEKQKWLKSVCNDVQHCLVLAVA